MVERSVTRPEAEDQVRVTPVPPAPERYRYRGPQFEFEFDAWSAREGGQTLERAGQVVEAIDVRSFRWTGERDGDSMSDEDRQPLADALGTYYRGRGIAYDIHRLSGEIEDETGRRRPGFRGTVGRFEHSDGWSLVDLFLSPDFPDASIYPPTIIYRDAEGEAEMIRRIEVADDVRQRVFVPDSLRWIGDRSGEAMTETDRASILGRIRSIYDYRGTPYRLE